VCTLWLAPSAALRTCREPMTAAPATDGRSPVSKHDDSVRALEKLKSAFRRRRTRIITRRSLVVVVVVSRSTLAVGHRPKTENRVLNGPKPFEKRATSRNEIIINRAVILLLHAHVGRDEACGRRDVKRTRLRAENRRASSIFSYRISFYNEFVKMCSGKGGEG